MKKINQRWLSATMAMAMAASMTVPALAADTTVATTGEDGKYSANTTINGKLEAPTIKLTVPQTGTVIINPYEMTVSDALDEPVSDQIINATQFIKNESNVDISVSATVKGEIAEDGEAVLATSALKGSETTKSVFMYFEIGESSDGSTDPTWGEAYASANKNMIAVSTKGTTKEDIYVLPSAGDESSTPTYAGFRLNGAAASNPSKAWTDKDKVNVSVAFTFNPVAAAGEAGAD